MDTSAITTTFEQALQFVVATTATNPSLASVTEQARMLKDKPGEIINLLTENPSQGITIVANTIRDFGNCLKDVGLIHQAIELFRTANMVDPLPEDEYHEQVIPGRG